MEKDNLIALSEREKNALFPTLLTLNTKLDQFSRLFFKNFLETDANVLFKNTDMDNLIKKFESAFKIVLYNLQSPINLQEHLNLVISNHLDYGIMPEHLEYFSDSFLKTLKEILGELANPEIMNIWSKLINQILNYFKNKLY